MYIPTAVQLLFVNKRRERDRGKGSLFCTIIATINDINLDR